MTDTKDLLSLTQPTHRDFRPYTKSGVFKSKLSAAQLRLCEKAGHGGLIFADGFIGLDTGERRPAGVTITWVMLRSMADKGAVEVVEREMHQTRRGAVPGRIISVRVI